MGRYLPGYETFIIIIKNIDFINKIRRCNNCSYPIVAVVDTMCRCRVQAQYNCQSTGAGAYSNMIMDIYADIDTFQYHMHTCIHWPCYARMTLKFIVIIKNSITLTKLQNCSETKIKMYFQESPSTYQ